MSQPHNKRHSRRQFLTRAAAGTTAVATAPYVITSAALGAAGAVPPSERITVGFIGLGSHGIGVVRGHGVLREDGSGQGRIGRDLEFAGEPRRWLGLHLRAAR